jgi:hypothetical protein
MISFDLECTNNHRFEGTFKDYLAFDEQLTKEMIECPVCGDVKIIRLFTGCSIQTSGSNAAFIDKRGIASHNNAELTQFIDTKPRVSASADNNTPNIFEIIRLVREYVITNFDNVGKDFADTAKAIHYGIEKERNIYGESTPEEIKELSDEGIDVLRIPDLDKIEN